MYTSVLDLILQTPDQDAVITGVIEGLTPGLHGFHIHQYGSILGGAFGGAHMVPSSAVFGNFFKKGQG